LFFVSPKKNGSGESQAPLWTEGFFDVNGIPGTQLWYAPPYFPNPVQRIKGICLPLFDHRETQPGIIVEFLQQSIYTIHPNK